MLPLVKRSNKWSRYGLHVMSDELKKPWHPALVDCSEQPLSACPVRVHLSTALQLLPSACSMQIGKEFPGYAHAHMWLPAAFASETTARVDDKPLTAKSKSALDFLPKDNFMIPPIWVVGIAISLNGITVFVTAISDSCG